MVYGTLKPGYSVFIDGIRVRCVNLTVRDKYALLGPSGISLMLKEGSTDYKYRVAGIESIDFSRQVSHNELRIQLINKRFAKEVHAWIEDFLEKLYDERSASQRKLLEKIITRH